MILCRLGSAQVKSLMCDIRTELAVKSKRQAHLWHRCPEMEQVMPFLGAKGTRGRKWALTQGSATHICHFLCVVVGSSKLSHICHLAHAMWVIVGGTTFCQKALP